MGQTAVVVICLFAVFVPTQSCQCCPQNLTALVYIRCWSFLHDKLKLTSTLLSSYQATANDLFDENRVNVSYTNSWTFLICHQSSETRVRFCLSYDCSKYGSHVKDFNARNICLTAKLLKQGYRYHKLRMAFSKFYRRHYELISKFNVGLKSVLHQGLSEPEFYGD